MYCVMCGHALSLDEFTLENPADVLRSKTVTDCGECGTLVTVQFLLRNQISKERKVTNEDVHQDQ